MIAPTGLQIESHSPIRRSERWLNRRVERNGLRPRDAAYTIGAFWAIEAVTTIGYGDIIPNQIVGKLTAGFQMLGGLSLLSVIPVAISSGFVSRGHATPSPFPGSLPAGVAVGMGAAFVAALRLPLSALVVATRRLLDRLPVSSA